MYWYLATIVTVVLPAGWELPAHNWLPIKPLRAIPGNALHIGEVVIASVAE